ncbi:cytochrome P450 4d8-like [Haematobia irritans]|uniref:cytochrome P450 4d8-like n=1 Tax=Haematobia irritans TaxID=7368 RepID=UPI003F501107
MNSLILFSADIELNEHILASPVNTSRDLGYKMLDAWFGRTISSGDQIWHTRRKIVTSAFNFKILEGFLEVFYRQANVLLECLTEKADGKNGFDIYPFVSMFTLDVIAETSMGIKLAAQPNKNSIYTTSVKELNEIFGYRVPRFHLHSNISFALLKPLLKLRQRKLLRIVHSFTSKVIEERRSIVKNMEMTQSVYEKLHEDLGLKKRYVLLDTLLQASVDGKPLTDNAIREEVDKVMIAGNDTLAVALGFTLHLLARHPRVQNKILKEISKVFGIGDNEMPFTLATLNELKYLECVIREALRLYPPGPMIGRFIEQDLRYKHSTLGEGLIPRGTNVIMFLNGSGDMYAYAKEFIPERFEANTGVNINYGRPFSAGPRNCLGHKYAMYSMKLTLVKILSNYELLPLGEKVQPVLHLVLRSANGFQLGMKKRSISSAL